MKTIVRLYRDYKPLAFFGMLSAILFMVSAVMFIPILYIFIQIGKVPNFPTLIVSGFIALAAIVSLFCGLILATIVEKEKQEFEFRLQEIAHWK